MLDNFFHKNKNTDQRQVELEHAGSLPPVPLSTILQKHFDAKPWLERIREMVTLLRDETIVDHVRQRPPKSLGREDLAQYSVQPHESRSLAQLIADMPKGNPVEVVGLLPTMWAGLILGGLNDGMRQKIAAHVSNALTIDCTLVERSFACCSRLELKDGQIAINFLSTLQRQESFLNSLNAPELAAKYWRGAKLSQDVLDRYELKPLQIASPEASCGPELEWGATVTTDRKTGLEKKYEVYLDAPISIGLFYNGEPHAMVSLQAESRKCLLVTQLQGIRGLAQSGSNINLSMNSWGLSKLDWTALLIEVAEAQVRDAGFDKIGILSGYNNPWTKEVWQAGPLAGQRRLEVATAIVRYDKNAERLGYSNSLIGNWYKNLTACPSLESR